MNSILKLGLRVLNPLVLPDPLLTQEGPVTFPACALYKLFVRSCHLAHHGLYCSHFCAYRHRSLFLHLSLVFAFVSFCSQMEEHQNVRLSTGTTEWNHSYYTGNSLSALHSLQQSHDDTVSTSVQPLVSTKETHGTTSSGSVSGPQLPHSLISSHVPAGPTRNVTGEVMPTSLAEAVTQLSFLEFLQRCNLLIAPPQPPHYQSPFHSWTLLCRRLHPVMHLRMCPRRRLISLSPRSLLTWQCRRLSTVSTSHLWMLPCRRSHTVLFLRTFLRRWVLAQPPRFLLTRLSRLLYAVLYHTILPHNYRSRSSLLDVSSLTILLTVRARHRHKAILVVPHRLNLLTLLRLAVSAVPVLTETITCALWPHVSCCSHHRVSRSMPTCAPHMVYLLKRHWCDLVCVHLSQLRTHSLMSVPPKWEHILCAQLLPTREVQVPP